MYFYRVSYCVSPLEPGTLVWNIQYVSFWHMYHFVLLLGLLLWNHTSVNHICCSTHVFYLYTATRVQFSSDHDGCQDRNILYVDEPFFEYSNFMIYRGCLIWMRQTDPIETDPNSHRYDTTKFWYGKLCVSIISVQTLIQASQSYDSYDMSPKLGFPTVDLASHSYRSR